MALHLARLSPNVASALQADPMEALTVEALRVSTPIDGYLGLNRSGPRSAFDARVSTSTGAYVASAVSMSKAVGDAIRKAEAAA